MKVIHIAPNVLRQIQIIEVLVLSWRAIVTDGVDFEAMKVDGYV